MLRLHGIRISTLRLGSRHSWKRIKLCRTWYTRPVNIVGAIEVAVVSQERMATVVHMKDKFFASEAKRKRAEDTVEQYKRRLHDLEQQLHARTAHAASQK